MNLRKINSVLIIIVVLLLFNHALVNILGMYGLIDYSLDFQVTGRRLFYPLVLHIIISLYLFFKDRSRKFNVYSKLISKTTQQVVSGIGIIIFLTLHILSYSFYPSVKSESYIAVLHFIIDVSLFISITIHLNISIPRFLMSFGFLENENSYKHTEKLIKYVLLIILVIIIVSEVNFYMGCLL